ncbi:hypothetical protein HNQ41_002288 [Texcoconibacillus texcoconensis]|uniref:Uncharacterized protein n=1 Tax=Texcoconibacillus texcoconensis TaxID=1095777 RepID=A0A840QRV9_9BACI|nr:hypothetical protein [Texcoconibacillus texcoconensis]
MNVHLPLIKGAFYLNNGMNVRIQVILRRFYFLVADKTIVADVQAPLASIVFELLVVMDPKRHCMAARNLSLSFLIH